MRTRLRSIYHASKPHFRWLWPWIIRGRDFLRWLPIQKIPVSSKYFGRPKGLYRTTHEYLESQEGRRGANSARQIYPAETIRLTLPTPLDGGEVHRKFRENQVKELPPSYVFELENARFWGHYGGSIITRDDRLLADLSHDVLGPSRHKVFSKFKLPPCRRLAGTAAVLATAEAATNYWHWTFDLLPRLHLMEKAGITPANVDYYLVNHNNLPFQIETLTEFGIRPEQIIRTDDTSHFEVERMVVSSLKPSQFHVAKWVCDFLYELAPQSEHQGNRRLYISRENASFRRLVNEAEVFGLLEEQGFEKVHCEKLNVVEQRRIFHEAEIVVAPHGSGLTNLVWCRPGTVVMEIFPANYVDVAFWTHASQSRLRHYYLLGRGAPLVAGNDQRERQANLVAEVAVLERALNQLFETSVPDHSGGY